MNNHIGFTKLQKQDFKSTLWLINLIPIQKIINGRDNKIRFSYLCNEAVKLDITANSNKIRFKNDRITTLV